MTQGDWSARLTRTVANEVRRHRVRVGLSAQQLSDRCSALGLPIQRSVLANLENGRRPMVTVAEVLVLAKALGVPPLLLLLPIGQEAMTEVLPGQTILTWLAAMWITGENPWPTYNETEQEYAVADEDFTAWRDGPLQLFRDHAKLEQEWSGAMANLAQTRARLDTFGDSADSPGREQWWALYRSHQEHVQHAERQIERLRQHMRSAGLQPPELRPDLAHLDMATAADMLAATATMSRQDAAELSRRWFTPERQQESNRAALAYDQPTDQADTDQP